MIRHLAATTALTGALIVALAYTPPTAVLPTAPTYALASDDQPSITVTVDGTDYPVCAAEDCSDQPGQVGVWFAHDGRAWLSLGETSVEVTQ